MTVVTVGGTLEDIEAATGFMIEFESGQRQYVGTLSEKIVFPMCDRFDEEGKTVAHARLCIKNGEHYTVLA